MKLIFKINIEKDFDNYYETANEKEGDFSFQLCIKSIPDHIRKLIENKTREEAYKNFMPILKESYKKYDKYLKIFLKQAEEAWELKEKEFYDRVEKITNKRFPFDEITVYLTTIFPCPYNYNEKWFMTSFLNQPLLSVQVCAHELLHFHFLYYYYDKIKEELGEEKAEDLKEALTVLLNLEFRDLFFISFRDGGFEKQRDLRKFIATEWEKKKDFDKLIEKCMSFLRQKYPKDRNPNA